MNRRTLTLALALAGTVSACGPKPPPVDTVDTAPTTDTTPPPPPPPKCEKLSEKCEAKAGKKVPVADIGLTIEPVAGWIYAKGDKATVAQMADDAACFALAGHEVPADEKKLDEARQTELEALVAEVGISLEKAKVSWKKPADKLEVGELKLDLWELKDVTRASKKGVALVVAGQPMDGKALLAVAFVPKEDEQSAGKIMESFQTLAPGKAK